HGPIPAARCVTLLLFTPVEWVDASRSSFFSSEHPEGVEPDRSQRRVSRSRRRPPNAAPARCHPHCTRTCKAEYGFWIPSQGGEGLESESLAAGQAAIARRRPSLRSRCGLH